MKNLILRFTLSAVLLVAAAVTPALAWGPGDPPPPGSALPIPAWVIVVSSLIHR
jgi:hypothetical protein